MNLLASSLDVRQHRMLIANAPSFYGATEIFFGTKLTSELLGSVNLWQRLF
jgi:hypothetical protein